MAQSRPAGCDRSVLSKPYQIKKADNFRYPLVGHLGLEICLVETHLLRCLLSAQLVQTLMQYCSLQHIILHPSPVTSTTGHYFCFGLASSFFLELFLHSFPVAYWAPDGLGSSSFSLFLPFHTVHGVLKARILKLFALSSPVDHVLSEI